MLEDKSMPYSLQHTRGGWYMITTATKKKHSTYPLTYDVAKLIALRIRAPK